MLLINPVQLLKLMILVLLAHHGTITAYRLLACDAKVVNDCPRMRRAILVLALGNRSFLALKVLYQILKEAAIDKLTSLQGSSAVRTLLPSLFNPLFEAISTS